MKEFEEYLRRIGKSENTALTYCRNIRMYFSWCRDSFGSEPKELYRSNVLEYISYMRNIRGYSPKSVNNHLSALRCLNKYLVQSGRQSDMAVLDSDFMKVQIQYASPCSVDAAHRIYQEHSEYREGADSYSVLEAYIKETQTEPMPEESKPEQDEMSENAIAWPVVDFAALESINSDCVAWIRIDGTEIDYPVVQGHDNSFYLKHLFGGEWNGAGCIFLDSRVNPDLSDRHSVLYGHHMKNGTMFSDIAKYKDQTFYENHTTGMILTPTENYRIEFFAGYVAGADDETAWKVTFATEDEYVDWLNETVGRSWFNSEVIPTAEDRVITLSTCSYEFNNARFVLIGRLK